MNSLLVDAFNLIINLAMFVIFLRFMLQFAGLDRWNIFVRPAYQVTQVVDLFGRIFPTVADGRINTAALVLLFLLQLIDITGNIALGGNVTINASLGSYLVFAPRVMNSLYLFCYTTLTLIIGFLNACRYLIIGSIIISWIVVLTNSMHPILSIIIQLAEPLLAPFRRITPNLGVIDISPIIAFFAILLAQKGVYYIAASILPMLG